MNQVLEDFKNSTRKNKKGGEMKMKEHYKQDSFVIDITHSGRKNENFPWIILYERNKERKPGTIGLGKKLNEQGFGGSNAYDPTIIPSPKVWTRLDQTIYDCGSSVINNSPIIRDFVRKRIKKLIEEGRGIYFGDKPLMKLMKE